MVFCDIELPGSLMNAEVSPMAVKTKFACCGEERVPCYSVYRDMWPSLQSIRDGLFTLKIMLYVFSS